VRQARGASARTAGLATEGRVKEPDVIEAVHHVAVLARLDVGHRNVRLAEVRPAEIATGREWPERAIPPKRWMD
jgi:hypothetical protein